MGQFSAPQTPTVYSGLQASRPTAAANYVGTFYFATDTRKRYICQDFGSGPVWALDWYDRRYPKDSNDGIVLRCNETSGTTLTNSGTQSSSNFTISGTPLLADIGAYDVGIGFTGSEYATGPSNYEPVNTLTVSMVVRIRQIKYTRFICKAYNGAHSAPYTSMFFYTDSGGHFVAGINVGATERIPTLSGNLLVINRPYHLALTYDNATIKVFIDGRNAGSMSQTGDIDWGNHEPWELSRFNAGEEYNGVLQDVRIANVARSDAYIREAALRAIGVYTEAETA